MPWWTWTALVFFAVVVAAGAAVTTAALFQMRRLTSTGEDLARALKDLNAKAEALQTKFEQAEQRSEVVERKLALVDASFDRLSVLLWALGDVRRTISHVTDAVTLRK